MSRRARNRAATAALVVLVAGLIVTGGSLTGTFASFTAETQSKTSTVSGGWVVGPTLSTAVLSGNGGALTWTHATTGVTGQEIWFADVGSTTASCTGPTYTGLVTGASLSATANSIGASGSPSDAVPAANQGDFICYQVRSTHNAWYTPATYATAIQVGLVPTAISYNGGGQLKNNTTITITFNHNPAALNTTETVTVTQGSIAIANVGTIAGGTMGFAVGNTSMTCTSTTVKNSAATVAIKLSGCNSGAAGTVTVSGSGTFTASGAVVSSSVGVPALSVNPCGVASVCKPTLTY